MKEPMKPSVSFEQHRQEIEQILERHPMISNVRVFGSVARGEDKEGSDLDLYVDAAPGTTLFDLGGFREDIIEILGVSVDIITSGPHVRKSMMENLNADARPLFSDKTAEKFSPCLQNA